MKKLACLLILLSLSSIFSSSASAHSNNSEGYSLIEVKNNTLDYELKVDLEELGHSLDKEIDQNELINSMMVQNYINSHIKLYADTVHIEGSIQKSDVEMIEDRQFAVMNMTYKIEQMPEKLVVDYNLFLDDSDPSHANFATIKMDGKQQEKILTYESRELEIGQVSFFQNIKQFTLLGLEHIFTGYDHILFVISLLFGVKNFRHIVSLVTAFTIAHSITLALATLNLVSLPSKLVESAIALSIVYVALINIFNREPKHQPWLAFGFGLIHGFGFAGILAEMRLDRESLAASLLSFNIGIELGQLIIVSLALPVIALIQKIKRMNWLIPGTSIGILSFGLVWFIQRAF
ncbi:HupE/UreJ family protein [Bacillus salipaludis]|uniref:HupE/UreJ family protein n=1 Tax=Bacillus salipaludis TaxID=2547811 RepID=A0ABW8REK3_9BACI